MKKIGVVLLLSMIVLSVGLFAGGQEEKSETPAMVASPDGFDWRQFAGDTVVACWPNHGHYNATIKSGVIEEFEELTGIDVEIDLLQYIKMHDKQVLEMTKPSGGDYDMVSMVVMWKAEYAMGGMIEPLKPYFDKPQLAIPDYDFDDLVPGYVEVTGIAGGENIYMNGAGGQALWTPLRLGDQFSCLSQGSLRRVRRCCS